jgi:hypothetical protein
MNLPSAPPDTTEVADMLIEVACLDTPEDVVDYFRKPHKWGTEAAIWRASGSPTSEDDGWALFVARLEHHLNS